MHLHPIQQKIYDLVKKGYQDDLSLRDIAVIIGEKNHQNVAHHIKQLEKKGYLRKNPLNPKDIEVLKDPIEDAIYINVFGFAQCGPRGLLADENLSDKIPISSKLFGLNSPENYFCVKAKGDSMEPVIKEKDLLLIKKQDYVDNNHIAVVVHNEVPKIKKIVKTENSFLLISINSSYVPEEVKSDDNFNIYGEVKHLIRFNI